jgi:hypothetical protein
MSQHIFQQNLLATTPFLKITWDTEEEAAAGSAAAAANK